MTILVNSDFLRLHQGSRFKVQRKRRGHNTHTRWRAGRAHHLCRGAIHCALSGLDESSPTN